MSIVIENARTRLREGTVNIVIENNTIQEIADTDSNDSADNRIDAAGCLVTVTFANPHIHIDQIRSWPIQQNQSGTVEEAFSINREVKKGYTVEKIKQRAGPAIEQAVAQGNTIQRGFADVDEYAGMTGIEALNELKKGYSDIIDIQVCAFAQEGLGKNKYEPGEQYLREAMEIGADVVGGIPWIEHTESEVKSHVDTVFEVATDYDADIHFLVDDIDSPTSRALEYVALKTIETGYEGRVACTHARSLAYYNDYHAQRVIDIVSEADVQILSNTHAVLFLHPNQRNQPAKRGLTRIRELQDAGVNVSIAQDDANDMYYPFGRNDMLELAWFASHAAQFNKPTEIDYVYDMVSTNAARAIGNTNHELTEGAPANLIIYNAENLIEVLRTQATKRYVIKDGSVVATNERETEVHRHE